MERPIFNHKRFKIDPWWFLGQTSSPRSISRNPPSDPSGEQPVASPETPIRPRDPEPGPTEPDRLEEPGEADGPLGAVDSDRTELRDAAKHDYV